MRDLVTVEWIRERDTAGLLQDTDSSTIESEITAMSNMICQKVGHDFGELVDAEQTLDGYEASRLNLVGKTLYPARSITAVYVDDVRIPPINIIARPHRRTGMISMIQHKLSVWDGYEVKIVGTWGWEAVPDEVMEAVYRLLCKEIKGNKADKIIRSVKHPDGVQVEYAVADSLARSRIGTGDDFADEVISHYRWKEGGGMV